VERDAGFNTSLIAWSATTGLSLGTLYAPGGFSLSDAEVNDRGELWVCRNDFVTPGLMLFSAGPDTLLAGPLDTGLPPYALTFDHEDVPLAVAPGQTIASLALAPPWPNPARAGTRISLALPGEGVVVLEVLDAIGRRVATVFAGALPAGRHTFAWNLRSGAGTPVPAGVYLFRARAGERAVTRPVVVVR
jgi:hypothetical protein